MLPQRLKFRIGGLVINTLNEKFMMKKYLILITIFTPFFIASCGGYEAKKEQASEAYEAKKKEATSGGY